MGGVTVDLYTGICLFAKKASGRQECSLVDCLTFQDVVTVMDVDVFFFQRKVTGRQGRHLLVLRWRCDSCDHPDADVFLFDRKAERLLGDKDA